MNILLTQRHTITSLSVQLVIRMTKKVSGSCCGVCRNEHEYNDYRSNEWTRESIFFAYLEYQAKQNSESEMFCDERTKFDG